MTTSFDQSLSASSNRPLSNSAEALSLADGLPSVNFGFDNLREVMNKFTQRFDDYIATGRKQVLEERNHFKLTVAELQEDEKMKHRAIEILSQKSTSHNQTLAKEAAESSEMESAIANITEQRNSRAAARDAIKAEIVATRKAIAAREEAQRIHASKLAGQAQYNVPELEFWTSALCMDIEGAGKDDHLRFVFTHIDEKDWEREAWFELCTEKREYEIVETKPSVESDKLEAALEGLNETRDLGQFLKTMREFFVAAIKA